MVEWSGYIHPTNKVIVEGEPRQLDRTAEEAGIKPGMVVCRGTTQDLVKIGDFTRRALGFAGYEQSFVGGNDSTSIYTRNRPEGLTGTYAINAKIPVLYLANFTVLSKMYAGSAALKGDDLALFSGGYLVAGKQVKGGFAVRLPFTKNTTEVSTGFVIPQYVIVNDVYIEATTVASGSHIDVGLAEVTGAETGGDADGFLDGESCVTAGYVQHVQFNATAGNNTLGALLVASDITSADTPALVYSIPKRHIGDGVAKTITYTTSNHTVAGNIWVVFDGLQVVGMSVEDVVAGANVLVRSTL